MNYTLDIPYPCVDNLDVNTTYGQMMLSNLGGLHSEMNAVTLYFYNHIILQQSWKELAGNYGVYLKSGNDTSRYFCKNVLSFRC